MRLMLFAAVVGAAQVLWTSAAFTQETATWAPASGRYASIGIIKPTQKWKDTQSTEDENIIVVLDTATGRIFHCGDVSGNCTGTQIHKNQ